MGATVALGTVFKPLVDGSSMRCLMAFLTLRYKSVLVMAERTVFGGMSSSTGSQGAVLFFMAGSAVFLRLLAVEHDVQRLMRVGMTMETVVNGLLGHMSFMTFEA